MRALGWAFALAVLLGGPALPLLGLVLADAPAPFSCGKGRCCCAAETAPRENRPCLRRTCGCGDKDAVPGMEPLRIEAVLPTVSGPAVAGPRILRRTGATGSLLSRPHAPPVPPPRRPLPA